MPGPFTHITEPFFVLNFLDRGGMPHSQLIVYIPELALIACGMPVLLAHLILNPKTTWLATFTSIAIWAFANIYHGGRMPFLGYTVVICLFLLALRFHSTGRSRKSLRLMDLFLATTWAAFLFTEASYFAKGTDSDHWRLSYFAISSLPGTCLAIAVLELRYRMLDAVLVAAAAGGIAIYSFDGTLRDGGRDAQFFERYIAPGMYIFASAFFVTLTVTALLKGIFFRSGRGKGHKEAEAEVSGFQVPCEGTYEFAAISRSE